MLTNVCRGNSNFPFCLKCSENRSRNVFFISANCLVSFELVRVRMQIITLQRERNTHTYCRSSIKSFLLNSDRVDRAFETLLFIDTVISTPLLHTAYSEIGL